MVGGDEGRTIVSACETHRRFADTMVARERAACALEIERLRDALITISAYAQPYRDGKFGALDRIAERAEKALNGN